jgi:CelD/BcsL family acetyltransferase involved in cellulose biosynthesis
LTDVAIGEFLAKRIAARDQQGAALSQFERSTTCLSFLRTAMAEMAKEGRAALHTLEVSGRVVAEDMYLGDAARPWLYMRHHAALDGCSPGHSLLEVTAAHYSSLGATALELGRGDEPYKYRLKAVDRWVYDHAIQL